MQKIVKVITSLLFILLLWKYHEIDFFKMMIISSPVAVVFIIAAKGSYTGYQKSIFRGGCSLIVIAIATIFIFTDPYLGAFYPLVGQYLVILLSESIIAMFRENG